MADNNDLYNEFAKKQQARQAFEKQEAGQVPTNEFGQPEYQVMQGAIDNWKNPNAYEDTWMNKIGDPIANLATGTRTGAELLGIGKGFGESLASIPNAFLSDENKIKPGKDLDKYVDPDLANYLESGRIVGNAVGGLAGAKRLGTALGGITGLKGTAARIAGTGGLEYLMGEQFPDLFGKGSGRYLAGALGMVWPVSPTWEAGASAANVGKRVVDAAEANITKYGAKVNKAASVVKGGEQIQEVLSRLKGEQRRMLSKTHPQWTDLPTPSQELYKQYQSLIDTLEGSLKKSMSPEQWKNYKHALSEFQAKAAPYKEIPGVKNVRAGTSKKTSGIPKDIFNMEEYSRTSAPEFRDEFQNAYEYLMSQHPELLIQKLTPDLPSIAKWGAGSSVGTGIGAWGYNKLKSNLEDNSAEGY